METVRLNTLFNPGEVPLAEYPRPQFERKSYISLNGKWDYAILRKSETFTGAYQGKILVPYSPESLLSGLDEGTSVTPDDKLYYHRTFDVPAEFIKAHGGFLVQGHRKRRDCRRTQRRIYALHI